jgi:hypothetical protein
MSFVYDKNKIGKKIASGGDRKVFMYGPDHVIKISSVAFLIGRKLHNKLVHDYSVCKRYLPDFLVETVDVTPAHERAHVEIQPYVKGEMLQKKHLGSSKVRRQLEQIISGVQKMVADGYPAIDLVGNGGVLTPCLSNIMVDSEGDLKVIDATLLEGKTIRPIGILLDILTPLVEIRQRYILKHFFA